MKSIIIQLTIDELSDLLQGHEITKQTSENARESTGDEKTSIVIKKEKVKIL